MICFALKFVFLPFLAFLALQGLSTALLPLLLRESTADVGRTRGGENLPRRLSLSTSTFLSVAFSFPWIQLPPCHPRPHSQLSRHFRQLACHGFYPLPASNSLLKYLIRWLSFSDWTITNSGTLDVPSYTKIFHLPFSPAITFQRLYNSFYPAILPSEFYVASLEISCLWNRRERCRLKLCIGILKFNNGCFLFITFNSFKSS